MTAPTIPPMAAEAETEAVGPTQVAPEPLLAWSLNDDEDREYPRFRSWQEAARIALAVVLFAAALGAGIMIIGTNLTPTPVTSPSLQTPTAAIQQVPDTKIAAPTPVIVQPTPQPTTAPPRQTSIDNKFISALQTDQINVHNPTQAIHAAHFICTKLDQGQTRDQIIAIEKPANPDMTTQGVIDFVDLSTNYYCPQ